MYKSLGLREVKRTNISLQLADRSIKISKGIVEDVLIRVDKFFFLANFIVDNEQVIFNVFKAIKHLLTSNI